MQGVLIPPVNQITKVVSVADFVLVIEKEASFRQLVSTGFAGMFPNGVLVTVCYIHVLHLLSISKIIK